MTITIYTYVCIHVYMYTGKRGDKIERESERGGCWSKIKIEDTRGGGGTSAL